MDFVRYSLDSSDRVFSACKSMAVPWGAIASAAGSLASAGVGAMASGNLNSRNRRWQEQMLWQQQGWQEKLIDAEREYNDPSNVRARIEKAGYNPYLYNGQADGLGSFSGGASASVPAPPATSSPLGAVATGLASAPNAVMQALQADKTIQGQQLDNDKVQYELQKQLDNDRVTDEDGRTAYLSSGIKSVADARQAQATANNSVVTSTIAQMNMDWLQGSAMDENGQPMTDEAGNELTNFDVQNETEQKTQMATYQKCLAEIDNLGKQGKVIDVDRLLKQFDLSFLKPLEEKTFRMRIGVLNSEITRNNADADAAISSSLASRAAVGLTNAQTQTENAMRHGRVSEQNSRSRVAKFGADFSYMDLQDRKADYFYTAPYRSNRVDWQHPWNTLRGGVKAVGDLVNDIVPIKGLVHSFK